MKIFCIILVCVIAFPSLTIASGVTIVTHGFQFLPNDTEWTQGMVSAVHYNWLIPGYNDMHVGNGYITVFGTPLPKNIWSTRTEWDIDLSESNTGEILIVINWSPVADYFLMPFNTTEVAEAVVDRITESQDGHPPLAELPIHLIGHSRGGSLICELARLLCERGIWVDHVTCLDPHPMDPLKSDSTSSNINAAEPMGLIDADPIIYENVLFADNYWQSFEYPRGDVIDGAYNRLLPDALLTAGGTDNEHADVHLWYHGTVDTTSDANVTVDDATILTTMRPIWYINDEDGGKGTGFRFSRIAEHLLGNKRQESYYPYPGSNSVREGYSIYAGGGGTRVDIDNKSQATWPNLVEFDVIYDGDVLDVGTHTINSGDGISIYYSYSSYNDPWTIELKLDNDLNPYNGLGQTVKTVSGNSTTYLGSATASILTDNWPTGGNGWYICGVIYDTGRLHTRYLYSKSQITVGSTQYPICGDVNLNGSVNIGDPVYLVNFIFKAGPEPQNLDIANVNCDDRINIGDIVYLVNFIFRGGDVPCADCP